MRARKKRVAAPPRPSRPRAAPGRQRQRLIDACISALHVYGPSRTTVEKVVAIANMSPGIVRFYFDSKAAMLVASLQFLSAEFEARVLAPVAALEATPVAALETLVDLYLDPELASSRKVSVWYSFWGEASSRQEYYDICGQKDERFAAAVRGLIERLILATGQAHLDPDGIALGLIGVLEMLWQGFAFQNEGSIDRAAAKHRCMAYLRSVFPGEFPLVRGGAMPAGKQRAARMEPADAGALPGGWQLLGHAADLPERGDFRCAETRAERLFWLRDADGRLRAYRNSCPAQPHALLTGPGGHLDGSIECRLHGLKFDLDGAGLAGAADLLRLDLALGGELVFVRDGTVDGPPPQWADAPLRPIGRPRDYEVQADWVVVMNQWQDLHPPRLGGQAAWSLARYLTLARRSASPTWTRRLAMPGQLVETRDDGMTVLQVRPLRRNRCVIQRFDFGFGEHHVTGRALAYLAGRMLPHTRRPTLAAMESMQRGSADFGYAPRLTAAEILNIMKAGQLLDT